MVEVPFFDSNLAIDGRPRAGIAAPVVAGAGAIGILGFAAGPKVRVVDFLGLADPIGSRLRLQPFTLTNGEFHPARGRMGHQKRLAPEWIVARFGAPTQSTYRYGDREVKLSPEWVAAAHRTLRCAPLRRLVQATTSPLTPGRFLSNIGDSFSLTRLRISAIPSDAERELCPPRSATG